MKIGRTLGIATRVAGGILRDRASRIGQTKPAASEPEAPPSAGSETTAARTVLPAPARTPAEGSSPPANPAKKGMLPASGRGNSFPADLGRAAGRSVRATKEVPSKSRLAMRGAKGFGRAVWGPLSHTGGVLWQEITGLFFALFGLFFLQNAYEQRAAWRTGAEHDHFLLYIALTALFFWFSGSSFLRARKRSKRRRGR